MTDIQTTDDRQTTDRRTGDSIIANVNVSSRSLKTLNVMLLAIQQRQHFEHRKRCDKMSSVYMALNT